MPPIIGILEPNYIVEYLQARGLYKQYSKAKHILITGDKSRVDFKERQPHGQNLFSFRINKQFRALGRFDADGDFIVSRIDNHQ